MEEEKKIMSRAARRKLKKPPVVVTTEMREAAREELRELRKHLRMVKSNGGRRKLRKLQEKREREDESVPMDLDEDYRPSKKGRRLEVHPPVQTMPNSLVTAKAEEETTKPVKQPESIKSKPARSKRSLDDE